MKECESNHTYREGSLICTCSSDGFWKSTNCKEAFHILTPKLNRVKKLKTNIACKPNSLHLLECNVCRCGENGFIELSSCTNRRCTIGHKVDPCQHGDILRTKTELCSCSDINLYIDRLCFKVSEAPIQEIRAADIESIMEVGKSWTRSNVVPTNETSCKPHTVLTVDCNKCICTETGLLACTDKKCLKPNPGLRTEAKSSFHSLPKLKNRDSVCVPNKQYRHKCNTCVCSLKGVPTCTTMICLDDFVVDKAALEATMLEQREPGEDFKEFERRTLAKIDKTILL